MLTMKITLASVYLLSSALVGSAFTSHSVVNRVASQATLTAIEAGRCTDNNDSVVVDQSNRRNFLANGLLAAAAVTVTLTTESAPAHADVADGNELPQGVAQFGRLVRGKVELTKVQKRVRTKSDEFDQQEWDNLGQFLRKVYTFGDDMKYLSKSFDAEKKEKANDLAETIRKLSKAADVPASNKNPAEFVAYTQQLIATLDKYFDLLRDVPDEI